MDYTFLNNIIPKYLIFNKCQGYIFRATKNLFINSLSQLYLDSSILKENIMKKHVYYLMPILVLAIGLLVVGCSEDNGTEPEPEVNHYVGWVVGEHIGSFGLIYYTANSGTSWTRQGDAASIPCNSLDDVVAIDENTAWAVGSPSAEGYAVVIRTTDAGETWIRVGSATELPGIELAGVDAIDAQTAWVAGDSGAVLKTTDGGATWTELTPDIPDSVIFGMVDVVNQNPDIIWAGGEDYTDNTHVAYRSTDGGTTWQDMLEGLFVDSENYAIIDIAALDENVVWAVGSGGGAYVSIDCGETWTDTDPGMAWYHINGVAPVTQNIAYIACDNDHIMRTDDCGGSWVEQTCVGDSAAGFGEYLGVTCIDENIVWMVSSDINGGQIFNTLDGGENWNLQLFQTNGMLRRVSIVNDLK